MIRNNLLAAMGCAVLASSASAQFFDNFDRADSGTLGANWTNQSTSVGIASNMAVNTGGGLSMATVNGFNAAHTTAVVTVDAFAGQTSGYVALLSGYAGTGLNQALFVKIQDNDGDGLFDSYGLYTGNNNSSGGTFASLANTYARARITLWMPDADTYSLGIDGDFNGTLDETFSRSGVTGFAGSLGTGVGLGIWSTSMADNYRAVPEPASLAALGLGALALMRRRKKKAA